MMYVLQLLKKLITASFILSKYREAVLDEKELEFYTILARNREVMSIIRDRMIEIYGFDADRHNL